MTNNRSTRLGVVASLIVFSVSSIAAAQQASAGPLGPYTPGGLGGVKIPPSSKLGGLGGRYSPDKVAKVPDGLPRPIPLPSKPGPVIPGPGPLPKPDKPHRPGRGGGHWGGAMTAGLIGGMALGAMAAQARPVVVAGDCWLEQRRVRDAYGNRYIKEVRVCDE